MLQAVGGFAAGEDWLDWDLRALQVVQTDSGAFLVAGTGVNGGLSLFALEGATSPQLVDHLAYGLSGLGQGLGLGPLAVLAPGVLALSGSVGGALRLVTVAPDLGLTQVVLPGLGSAGPGRVTGLTLEGGPRLVYGSTDGQLTGWQLTAEGQLLGPVANQGAAADFALAGPVVLETAMVAGQGLLLVADGSRQGVQSYLVAEDGATLTAAARLGPAEGLGVNAPAALQVVSAYGSSWAVLAATGSSSLSVLQLGPEGEMTLVDQLIDSRHSRFGGVSALEVVDIDGQVLVLAAGNDGGLSLLRLLPDGQLVLAQTLVQEQGLGLQTVTAIETRVTDTQLQVFVGSQTAAGIARFSLDLDQLGPVLQAPVAATLLEGGAGGDLLLARNDLVTLHGRDGDDMLVAGAGGGVLTGGAGADLFVLCPSRTGLRISDFEPGVDRIDMSLFAGLRSLEQLEVRGLSNGIRLAYQDTSIVVQVATGERLTLDQLWPLGFDTPFRMPPGETLPGGALQGTAAADVLRGTADPDVIRGLGGADLLQGQGGRDRLFGGQGRDSLDGGSGNDLLKGGKGNDALTGAGGRDTLLGQGGQDSLAGHAGRDRLLGGAGRDSLEGNRGADHLEGGAGRDLLTGGGGRDVFVFRAGHGRDRLVDFTPGVDRIDLSDLASDFAELTLRARGDDTLLDTGGGVIRLLDLTPEMLGADDFLF